MASKVLDLIVGAKPKDASVSTVPTTETEGEKKKAKRARSALLETEGGITGSELQPGQVSTRDTLFGN